MLVKEGKHLIIDRHEGEQVGIGDPKNPIGIVEVVKVMGNHVKLRFNFPVSVQINREEIAIAKTVITKLPDSRL